MGDDTRVILVAGAAGKQGAAGSATCGPGASACARSPGTLKQPRPSSCARMTGPGYCAAMSRDLGRPVRYQQIPWESVRSRSEDIYRMYDFFEREGHAADIAHLRGLHPGLQSFPQWLNA